jgi:cytochrome d ubiquinol oxidase subunit I
MIGMGFLMLGVGLWSLWSRYQGRLFEDRWLHRAALLASPAGLIAVIAGWITTEVGRQPYTVYGELLTVDSVSPLAASDVGTSLIAFIVIYFLVFGAGVFYILRLMSKRPHPGELATPKEPGPIRTAGITPAPQMAADPSLQPGE